MSIKISLKFVPKGPRRQAIIWANGGYFTDANMSHSALMSEQNGQDITVERL